MDRGDGQDPGGAVVFVSAEDGGADYDGGAARPVSQTWLDSGLELAWSAAAGEEVADECAELLDALGAESDEDEGCEDEPTSRVGFHADQAIGLVWPR
ncbi:hypothetical protein SAMN04487983_10295 [Streptomyces sp. yr375]|uniref:hypothetical protein n=1 Tax=Streptomyces sp. yr375 TaxID=1761906 RepID=UPI0008AFA520|nr:hypothetical protein [Streptomyces sp. yr375]SES04512.1 hypothetical protein SAMN04487983_10295 [Streptomyces sp. yr375]